MTYPVVLANFTNEVAESLINVYSLLGGGLDEFATEVFGKVAAL